MYDIAALRAKEFPWTRSSGKVYLNHAGSGPIPARTVAALQEWASLRSEPWRASDHEVIFPGLARVRSLCAGLIGAATHEIALVPNTSFGLNLAARSLPLDPGDIVLACDGEFPSVIYSWRAVERARGIKLELIPVRHGLPNEEALIAALDDSRVRAVTVSWVGFATGYRIDLERLADACRKRNVYLIVDAIQGIGPLRLDVRACGVDIVACGGEKWLLSPWGSGFVYVREALIEQLDPPFVGWFIGPHSEDYTRLLDYDLTYFADARRFETMTLPAQDFIAMGRSIDLLFELGLEAIERHVRSLTDRIVDWAVEHRDMRLLTPADPARRGGIVSVIPSDPPAASRRLRDAGIMHSLREGAIRLSPYLYNNRDEVDTALGILGRSENVR